MHRVLLVSNGYGESAIAERIAREIAELSAAPVGLDHLALVGEPRNSASLTTVGPRRTLPSGGLVAMGNIRALARDLLAGLASLTRAQFAFARRAGNRYDVVIAVGDAFALVVALAARRRTMFVGTAKSIHVAPYGPFERSLLRRAARVFVRDEPTAKALHVRRVAAEAPGNVIVDLIDGAPPAPPEFGERRKIGLLPGSRARAYGDAVRLAEVARDVARRSPGVVALLSIAPSLDPERVAGELRAAGWQVDMKDGDVAFEAVSGPARMLAWSGPLGTLLRASALVIGQAGTANEQAASLGLPVVALDVAQPARRRSGPGEGWYRMRQRRLLGDALALVPPAPEAAAEAIAQLLADESRMTRMGAAGKERMGRAGGARAIAQAVLEMLV